VREVGTGSPPLILLHGFTATAALNWGSSFQTLGARFRTIGLDQRGHGRGIKPSALRGFRLEDCADDVVALADELGIDTFIPVGYSMGGPVAQLICRRHPSRVAGVVLCATASRFGRDARPAVRMALTGGVTGLAAAMRTLPPPVRRQLSNFSMVARRRALDLPEWVLEEVGRNDAAAMLEGIRALQYFDSRPWVGSITAPAAVVVTEHDRLVPPQRQHRLATRIPGASVWPVEGDHAVCVMDPARFVPVLLAACTSVAERAGLVGV
jgi:3-oxoadipate enol-lactonase